MIEQEDKRKFKGFILNCLACNRSLCTIESKRTYKGSDELVGLCNHCIQQGKKQEYSWTPDHSDVQEGMTGSKHSDSHSDYYYEYFY